MGTERAGVLAPTVQLSSELMEETTRNTFSFARKRIAVFRHYGNENRPGACQAGCIFAGDENSGSAMRGAIFVARFLYWHHRSSWQ